MVNTGEIDPTELAGEIVEKALDSEPVRNLLGPLTKNIGLILGQASGGLMGVDWDAPRPTTSFRQQSAHGAAKLAGSHFLGR